VWADTCTPVIMDTRPEDLLVAPVMADGQKLRYIASPLVSVLGGWWVSAALALI